MSRRFGEAFSVVVVGHSCKDRSLQSGRVACRCILLMKQETQRSSCWVSQPWLRALVAVS